MFWQAWVVQVALEHEMELYYTQSERATFLFTHLGRGRKKYFLIRQLVFSGFFIQDRDLRGKMFWQYVNIMIYAIELACYQIH